MQSKMLIIIIAFLLSLCQCAIQLQQITQNKLKQIQVFDGAYHFIILDTSLLPGLTSELPSNKNVAYYTYDCKTEKPLLKACQPSHKTAMMVVHNKVPIQYEAHINQPKQQLVKRLKEWVHHIINAKPIRNAVDRQILDILSSKYQLFILVQNKTIPELQVGYNVLAKQFYYKDFVYLSDLSLAQSYNLNVGDLIHIKKSTMPIQYQQGLPFRLIQNKNITTLLPKDLKRYDMMKLFVIQNMISNGFNKNLDNFDKYRFNLKVRDSSKKEQERIVYVVCDLQIQCIKYLQKMDEQLTKEHKQADTVYKRIFYRFESIKIIQVLQVYYHVKLSKKKMPYVLVLDGQDPSIKYLPLRYFKQLIISSISPLTDLQQFLDLIDQGRVDKQQLISQAPKKNGFYGKGSQKNVQKLTYSTYKTILENAKYSKTFYLMYITAFQFDCPQCVTFYNDYKKLASFLSGQENMKVTFGVYDLSKDQLDLQYLNNVPLVLLFSPYQVRPIEYQNRFQFQYLLRFLKTQIAKATQKSEKQNENPQL